MDMKESLYNRDQVAEIFHVDKRTVDRWIKNGQLRRADTPGGIVRIPRSEIERRMQAIPELDAEQPEE
jgi:excisionase family DNA binding protein